MATEPSSLVTASCNLSLTSWSALFLLAVSRAVLALSKVSFCCSNALFFSSTTLAFSVASALSFSATLVNFSIFSAKSSAISVSFLTIGLEVSFLSSSSIFLVSSASNFLVSSTFSGALFLVL